MQRGRVRHCLVRSRKHYPFATTYLMSLQLPRPSLYLWADQRKIGLDYRHDRCKRLKNSPLSPYMSAQNLKMDEENTLRCPCL